MLPMMAGYLLGGAAADWWAVPGKTCVVAYQPKGAASLAASYVNLANPGTYNAAPGTAPTWDAVGGWEFTGASSQYLTTQWTASSTSISMFVRFSDGTAGRGCIMGALTGRAQFLMPYFDADRRYYNGSFSPLTVAGGAVTSGVMGFAAATAYLNGSSSGAIPGWGDPAVAVPMYIGAGNNNNGSLYNAISAKVQAVAIYSDTLSGAEVATLSARMAAL